MSENKKMQEVRIANTGFSKLNRRQFTKLSAYP